MDLGTKKGNLPRKVISIIFFVIVATGVFIFAGLWVLNKTIGFDPSDFRIDWQAISHLQPPYLVDAPRRIFHIDFSNREKMEEALNASKARIDLWSISDNQLFGQATDANIKRLRKAGLQVIIDYATFEEYQNAVEDSQEK